MDNWDSVIGKSLIERRRNGSRASMASRYVAFMLAGELLNRSGRVQSSLFDQSRDGGIWVGLFLLVPVICMSVRSQPLICPSLLYLLPLSCIDQPTPFVPLVVFVVVVVVVVGH